MVVSRFGCSQVHDRRDYSGRWWIEHVLQRRCTPPDVVRHKLDRADSLSYNHRMNKQAISVTLDSSNLLWLRTQVAASGCRSVSEMLNRLIHEARTNGRGRSETVRSVVGTIQIAESDPNLSSADAAIRTLFPLVLGRRSSSSRKKKRLKEREASHSSSR